MTPSILCNYFAINKIYGKTEAALLSSRETIYFLILQYMHLKPLSPIHHVLLEQSSVILD